MNQESRTFLAGDFISENAVRGELDRRPPAVPNDAADDRRPRRLRRWSVAQLISKAVARPPTGGVAH